MVMASLCSSSADGLGRQRELLEDAVRLAVLEAEDLGVLVNAEVDLDLVEVGQIGVDVAGVAGEVMSEPRFHSWR